MSVTGAGKKVQDFFEAIKNSDSSVKCKLCPKEATLSNTSTSMKKHLQILHPEAHAESTPATTSSKRQNRKSRPVYRPLKAKRGPSAAKLRELKAYKNLLCQLLQEASDDDEDDENYEDDDDYEDEDDEDLFTDYEEEEDDDEDDGERPVLTQEEFDECYTIGAILSGRPFKQLEPFRPMMQKANPQIVLKTSKEYERDTVPQIFDKIIPKLKEFLKSELASVTGVAFSAEILRMQNFTTYSVLGAANTDEHPKEVQLLFLRYIGKDFQLQKRLVLAFEPDIVGGGGAAALLKLDELVKRATEQTCPTWSKKCTIYLVNEALEKDSTDAADSEQSPEKNTESADEKTSDNVASNQPKPEVDKGASIFHQLFGPSMFEQGCSFNQMEESGCVKRIVCGVDHLFQVIYKEAAKCIEKELSECQNLWDHWLPDRKYFDRCFRSRQEWMVGQKIEDVEHMDIPNRIPDDECWESEFYLLNYMVCVRPVLESIRDHPLLPDEDEEWHDEYFDWFGNRIPCNETFDLLDAILPYVEVMESAWKKLTQPKGVTVQYVVSEIWKVITKLEEAVAQFETESREAKYVGKLLEGFKKHFPSYGSENPIYAVANLLNPVYRGVPVKKFGMELFNAAFDLLIKQNDNYIAWSKRSQADEQQDELLKFCGNVRRSKSEIEVEWDQYEGLPSVKMFFGDALTWWKTNAGRFPLLAASARKFLCVPAVSGMRIHGLCTDHYCVCHNKIFKKLDGLNIDKRMLIDKYHNLISKNGVNIPEESDSEDELQLPFFDFFS